MTFSEGVLKMKLRGRLTIEASALTFARSSGEIVFSCSWAFSLLSFVIPGMISPHMILRWLCFCILDAALTVESDLLAPVDNKQV
jgi:hypothetical protein